MKGGPQNYYGSVEGRIIQEWIQRESVAEGEALPCVGRSIGFTLSPARALQFARELRSDAAGLDMQHAAGNASVWLQGQAQRRSAERIHASGNTATGISDTCVATNEIFRV